MNNKLGVLRKFFFGLPISEANFEVRGFLKEQAAQHRLELVAKVVVSGYNTAIELGLSDNLLTTRKMVNPELVGFFNEGIGMGLYTRDLFSIGNKRRFWDFVENQGKQHEYMSYIGAGIACGVFKRHSVKKFLEKASPTNGLLILNGLGFYYAYFKPKKTLDRQFIPKTLVDNTFLVACYDNGIGRALWFYGGGNATEIAKIIATFPTHRQGPIWSGVGLAATYAGGVQQDKLKRLKVLSGKYAASLAEGAILATHTRDVADNSHEDDSTIVILSGKNASEVNCFAKEAVQRLQERRYIDGKHSFEVFLEDIRAWARQQHAVVKV